MKVDDKFNKIATGASLQKRKRCSWVRSVFPCLLVVTLTMVQARAGNPAPARYRPDRILIMPRQNIRLLDLDGLHSRLRTRILRAFPRIARLQVVKLPAGISVPQALAAFRLSGLTMYAEPDYSMQVLTEPNDFRYVDQSLWGLHNTGIYGGTPGADIHAPEAWDLQTSASNIIVAVIDTGIRYTHEDLAPNMWINPGETGLDQLGRDKRTNGVDDDGDGYVDDVHGINTLTGSGDPDDDYGHGSHVAGTIGGAGNNGIGVVGVCWQVQLMACKFIDPHGIGSISDAITCIDYARSKGAKVINASWGSYLFTSAALRDAINSARDAGMIFVAAAGNDANSNESSSLFPASYEFDNVIGVAATTRNDDLAFFSNYGSTTVALGAPGYNVFSCWNGSDSDYRYVDGTSMAAPHVAGACALIWAHYPTLTHQEVIRRVLGGVDPLPALAGRTITGGRLNIAHAIQPQPAQEIAPITVWVDDFLPAGAISRSWNDQPWVWVTNNPAPFSGGSAHQSNFGSGLDWHAFEKATDRLEVFPGDMLFTHVYLDPVHPPRELMIMWNDGCWEHRAFWGDNAITWGASDTSSRWNMGPLPPVGQWVRLEVPAGSVALEGSILKGLGFAAVDGIVTWDDSGRRAGGLPAQ